MKTRKRYKKHQKAGNLENEARFTPRTKTELQRAINLYIKRNDRSRGEMNTWNVSLIKNMKGLFLGMKTFNENINDWDVSNVKTMEEMFFECSQFNQPLDKWNVSKVETMRSMFYKCVNFNQPLNNWNVSNVNDMQTMFLGCASLNQDFSKWVINSTARMVDMFKDTQISSSQRPRYLFYRPVSQPEPQTQTPQTVNQMLNRTINPIPIKKNTSNIIDYAKTSIDIMSGQEISVKKYLKEDPDNIVFILDGFYYYSQFSGIEHLQNDENVIKYPCFKVGNTIVPKRKNVDLERPIFPLKSIGLHSGYILLGNVKWILANKHIRAYILTEKEKIPSVVSKQMMGPTPNAVSATHCQEGHSDTIYNIMWLETDLNNISPNASNKYKTINVENIDDMQDEMEDMLADVPDVSQIIGTRRGGRRCRNYKKTHKKNRVKILM